MTRECCCLALCHFCCFLLRFPRIGILLPHSRLNKSTYSFNCTKKKTWKDYLMYIYTEHRLQTNSVCLFQNSIISLQFHQIISSSLFFNSSWWVLPQCIINISEPQITLKLARRLLNLNSLSQRTFVIPLSMALTKTIRMTGCSQGFPSSFSPAIKPSQFHQDVSSLSLMK